MGKIDETDRKIIASLVEDSSRSMREIAKLIGVALTTVHSRLRILKKEGIIRKFTIKLDHERMGKHVLAIVSVTIGYDYVRKSKTTQNELVRSFLEDEHVEDAFSVTGHTDIILKVRARSMDDLNDYLISQVRKIPGVIKTNTQVVLYQGSGPHKK